MEGLLIAEVLRQLAPQLPSPRLSWRFPDPFTFVLPLKQGALWIYNKPPNAQIALKAEVPPVGGTHTGFQDLLVARAGGPLLEAEQFKLDRALKLRFGAREGFVSTPPVALILELTGRNCNLILTDDPVGDPGGDGALILGVAREVSSDINRFRQLRTGLRYTPPPPYDKLDPRVASDEALTAVLTRRPLSSLRKTVDGVGPELTAVVAQVLGRPRDALLEGEDVRRAISALRRLTREPSRVLEELGGSVDLSKLRHEEAQAARLGRLRSALEKRRGLAQKRLDDVAHTLEAALEADELRANAALLMAYQIRVPTGASKVTLTDFSGEPKEVGLEPRLSAVENAQALYERAKKRLGRLTQAETREDELQEEIKTLEALIANLPQLDEVQLAELAARYVSDPKPQAKAAPGTRYTSPQGFDVWVGRTSKGNDELTFKLAKSRDLWLHVQGYPGSHVIVHAENKDVPFETVLFAAQLAAAYSKAGDSGNVPVDYTLKKNVWKVKGAPPGAVNFSQQKTVYVTPSRRPEGSKQAREQ